MLMMNLTPKTTQHLHQGSSTPDLVGAPISDALLELVDPDADPTEARFVAVVVGPDGAVDAVVDWEPRCDLWPMQLDAQEAVLRRNDDVDG